MPSAQETVAACALLASLDDKQRKSLAQDLVERRYAAGDVITSQDTGGIAFFLIGEGTVDVSVSGERQGEMAAGDTFGEIGLLTGAKRTAALIAATDVQCWVLSQWHFKPLVTANPEIAWAMLERLARRIADARA